MATLPQFSAVVQRLGGEVGTSASDDGEFTLVGSLAGLPVWAGAMARRELSRSAGRLARRGKLGLVIGHDSHDGFWQLAVTLHPIRFVTVASAELDSLPLRRVARAVQVRRTTLLEQALAVAEALDLDAAGRRTFRLLYALVDRAVSLLPASVSRADRHAWALAQLTRLLFLRFVESEGWLDGKPRFLAEAFDRCLIARRDPSRHLLHPLFFGTLNRECDRRSRFARAFGAVPFLNGGLFEPHAIERRHRLHLPVDYWRDAFAALVDRVDVTLDPESDDGCVTPELLGRVFEGVMHPLERKQQGAFFTPPPLVDALLREAIAAHLAPRVQSSEAAIRDALDDPGPELHATLLNVTVLDPAVGSGAFLVGALALLHGPGPRDPARVRHLVTRRLFGIDRHPVAVRICELRLWLEVLRAMRGRAPGQLPPLPNLDATVRAGDALIDPLPHGAIDISAARRIHRRQRAIAGAHGAAKRVALAATREAERRELLRAMRDHEAAIDRAISELLADARAPTLFGDRPRATASQRRELAERRRERADLRAERRRLMRDHSAAPFAIAAAFAPIITGRHGFDLIVGNPPWVRAERLSPPMRRALASRYRWWRSGGYGWRHLPDLAVAFVERGFNLLAPGGTLGFLVPSKMATADYGRACRSELSAKSTMHVVADLENDPRAGFQAVTYPLALITSRRPAPAGHTVRFGLARDVQSQPQSLWHDAAEWITASPAVQRIAARLRREHPRLIDQVKPHLGVKTGANAAFLDPPAELRDWCRPAVRGRDVSPFNAPPGAMLLWPADDRGGAWTALPPPVARYLAQQIGRLERRADQLRGPWWQLFRTRAATAPHRVIWRDLAPALQAAPMWDARAVPLNTCYVAALPSAAAAESLAGWLNANPIRVLARLAAEPAAGGCARFAARTVGNLPLPTEVLGHPVLASLAHSAADHDVQPALDECAADLLGLSPPELGVLLGVAADRC